MHPILMFLILHLVGQNPINVQVKGHPLAESSKVVTKDSLTKLKLKKILLKHSKENQKFVLIGK